MTAESDDKPAKKTDRDRFKRTRVDPTQSRAVDVTNLYLDPIEAMCVAFPSQQETTDKNGRTIGTKPHHWVDAMLAMAVPIWEQHALDVITQMTQQLGRFPRPDEIANGINQVLGRTQLASVTSEAS